MHRRHELGVRGDERNVKVKLSNYITENLVFWNWNWLRLVYVLDCFSMVWLLFVTLACVMVLPCFAIFFPMFFPSLVGAKLSETSRLQAALNSFVNM